jgi:ectoine hydroxylase-related dioxygenase (phytanoyl-CoA dioxygenase family)
VTDDYGSAYREQGYVLVRGVFSSQEVDEMREAVDGILDRVAGTQHDRDHTWRGNLSEDEARDLQLKGFHDLSYHDAVFTRMVSQPRLVGVLTELIGPNVQLHHTKMLVKPPERGAPFPMHQDYPYFPHTRHSVLAASVHLDDTDLENGCLHVVPGSHRLGPLEVTGASNDVAAEYSLESGTPCPAAAGDVLFFNYLTIHGSGVNRSERVRRNVLAQYRDPADPPLVADGVEEHVDWGMGLMVAGSNEQFWQRRPRFRLEPTPVQGRAY